MCTEEILDISKTILSAPGEGGDRPLSTSPLLGPPNVPSRPDEDSSSVDSDYSTEREIQTFWALKAQWGSLLARTDTCLQSAESTAVAWPQQAGWWPQGPVSKTLDLSLSRKRKCRGDSNTVWSSTPPKTRKMVKQGALDLSQGKASEAPRREGKARERPLS